MKIGMKSHCGKYTGKEFKQCYNEQRGFFVLLDNKHTFIGVKYTNGPNEGTLPFTYTDKYGDPGFYFLGTSNLHIYAGRIGNNIAFIEIPDDACVYDGTNKFKADKLTVNNIYDCNDLCDDFWISMIQQNGYVIKYIKEQTPELCALAVQKDGLALQFIKQEFKTDEICKLAVQRDGYALQYVENKTDEICKLAVQCSSVALRYVRNQTDELCKLAMLRNEYALEMVKNQTPELCMYAIQQYSDALQYVKNQTDEICKYAVQKDGCSIRFVRNQTEELCTLAIEQNILAQQYVKINLNKTTLQYVKNQTE